MIKKVFNKIKEKPSAGNSGFTLIEVLAAILILTISGMTIMQMFLSATKTNSKSKEELQATITADSVVESAKAFAIFAFDQQCKGNKPFSLIPEFGDDSVETCGLIYAGKFDRAVKIDEATGAEIKNASGQVVYDEDKIVYKVSKSENLEFASDKAGNVSGLKVLKAATQGGEFPKRPQEVYVYAINGIKQSNNRYDAIVVFQKIGYPNIVVDGSSSKHMGESSITDIYGNINYEYKVSAYVYKHRDDPSYIGRDVYKDKTDFYAKIEGSKLDCGLASAS